MTDPAQRRAPRIAYLSFSSGEYDARTMRMARSSIAAGYDVSVYSRWHPGLAAVEERDGYRLVRVPFDWQLAIPGLRGGARRRAAAAMAAAPMPGQAAVMVEPRISGPARRLAGRLKRRLMRPIWRWWRLARVFPLRPLGWAAALETVAEPADIWHGMWAGSLPALKRLRRRHGGRTIYDSRDVYMQSRDFAEAGGPGKRTLEWLERCWAHDADLVLTVNEPYAELLTRQLHITRPPVVMNCPEAWRPPVPRPDLIREALGLGSDVSVVLYQGQFISGRGIEQAMAAILEVPDAVLALLGFGSWLDRLTRETAGSPFAGRVAILPAVPPSELLRWTASADVSVVAIQPTSLNHRYTTPQKLFESIAAGVPVVASDLPGMADIIRTSRVGLVCDPQSPAAIAAAIREIVAAPAAEREAQRALVLRVAHEQYNWDAQLATLLAVYRELLPVGIDVPIANPSVEGDGAAIDSIDRRDLTPDRTS